MFCQQQTQQIQITYLLFLDYNINKAFGDLRIEPLTNSRMLTVKLPGKAPAAEFNNFTITAHDIHLEAVGK